ncbi:MAG TPA: MASE4 domain-containing protein [Reyranella sp.]|nr:MASE4 domain-containing protein [Reyranella sp.]
MADTQDRFLQTGVTARAGSPAVSAAFATTTTLIGLYLAIGAVLLAFADHAGPELPGFNALFSGGVFVIEGVTCFLLMVVYRRQPRRSVLLLVAAYLFSALMSLGYLLAYPGAIAPGRPLMGTPQSIAWIYNSWIVGFASLTFAAVLLEVLYGARRAPDRKARRLAVIVPTMAAVAAVLFITVATVAGDQLPLLATGGAWTSLNAIVNSTAAVLLAGGVVLILFALRPPRELFLWLSLALAAIAIGNVLSVFGGGRYTVGWYACRLSWLLSSGVLLLYFLGQFVRQESQLTRATDDLEERTRERDRIWSVSEDLLGVVTFDGDFVSVNPAWEKVLGWSEAEVKGLQIDGLRHPDDAAHSLQARRRLAEGVPTVRFQNRFRHKDGSWHWISWAMMTDQGLIYVSGRDVTAERQAEEALRKAEADAAHRHKMEALGQLTGGVAHDFNNLLMIVSGYIPRLKEAVGSDLKASQAALAIESASRRGAALTRQLLSFSRRQPLNPETVDTASTIRELEPILRSTVGPQVRLAFALARDLGMVHVDSSELELALLNIVLNARDAIPKDGVVTISAENRQLEAGHAPDGLGGAFVVIAVSDSGQGMRPDVLSRAFDPFFTTKAVGKGTGLGLSQVHGFCRQSGGTVTIDSTPGSGTVVTLYLPRSRDSRPIVHDDETSPGAAAGKVLLVEDNVDVAEVSQAMLEQIGYTVRLAADARQALVLFEAEEFDLVVSDIVMPGGMNGIELAEELRHRSPRLPIVLVSGYAASASAAPEQFPVLRKPFRMEQLAQAIARVSS